jgi:hypothetical protein
MSDDYPVGFSVDYPDRDLNRLTTALRRQLSNLSAAIQRNQ